MKYITRIIVLPFVFAIIFTAYVVHAFNNTRLFLLYGGEWNTYTKDDKVTMQKIYLKLKENEQI